MVEVTYECLSRYSKVVHIAGAALLLVLSIGKWASLKFTRMEFVLAFYYVFLAFIIVIAEFPFKCFACILDYFGYMKYNFGKAGNSLFLFGLTVGKEVLNIAVCIFFGLASIAFFILGFACKRVEKEKLDDNKTPANTSGKPNNTGLEQNIDLNAAAAVAAAAEMKNKI
jgi:hypothetical protein